MKRFTNIFPMITLIGITAFSLVGCDNATIQETDNQATTVETTTYSDSPTTENNGDLAKVVEYETYGVGEFVFDKEKYSDILKSQFEEITSTPILKKAVVETPDYTYVVEDVFSDGINFYGYFTSTYKSGDGIGVDPKLQICSDGITMSIKSTEGGLGLVDSHTKKKWFVSGVHSKSLSNNKDTIQIGIITSQKQNEAYVDLKIPQTDMTNTEDSNGNVIRVSSFGISMEGKDLGFDKAEIIKINYGDDMIEYTESISGPDELDMSGSMGFYYQWQDWLDLSKINSVTINDRVVYEK